MKLQNNNILTISPEGKEYLSTLHWLKTFIPLLLSKREVTEVQVKGLFDNHIKGAVHVSSFPTVKPSYDFVKFVEELENNEVIEIKGWHFTLTKTTPKALYKVDITKKKRFDNSVEYTAKW